MAKRSPPTPFEVGSINPWAALAAIAASTALPPRWRICAAACAARGWLAAATPCCEAATERPGTGRAATRLTVKAIMARVYHRWAKRVHSSLDAQGEAPGTRRHRGRHRKEAQLREAEGLEGHPSQ